VAGDEVTISLGAGSEQGVIEEVLPRRSYLTRPPIANVDQILVIFAFAEPPLDPMQLSRFLVQAEASGLPVFPGLNKTDLVSVADQAFWQTELQRWGYDPFLLSTYTGQGMKLLQQQCRGKISVVMGLSGVGKTSLLNTLVPDLTLATQAVSGRLRHGRHTTRHVELFPLSDGGWLADSPGFNQADLANCHSRTVANCFPEIRDRLGSCQFRDCYHQEEPGCCIRVANWSRYSFYRSILAELQEREEGIGSHLSEAPTKVKSIAKASGSATYVPRLRAQYRQPSRRQRRQAMRVEAVELDGEESI
jgi:ribosome biogenesis GTPase